MKIVVAQYDNRRFAKALGESERLQRFGATVDEITGKPEPIGTRAKVDTVEEAVQGLKTPLQVAYGVSCHGTESLKASSQSVGLSGS